MRSYGGMSANLNSLVQMLSSMCMIHPTIPDLIGNIFIFQLNNNPKHTVSAVNGKKNTQWNTIGQ